MKIKPLKIMKLLGTFISVSIALFAFLAPAYTYQRFNSEYPIATLEFTRVLDQQYVAELRAADYCDNRKFVIKGDQWQLDASFVKWTGLGVMLGFDSRYRLDRLSGRYRRVAEQNANLTLAHNISPESKFNALENSAFIKKLNPLIDTVFGSSVYLDINTDDIYNIYRTEDALIVKSIERESVVYENGVATIKINHACGEEPSMFDGLVGSVNDLLNKIFSGRA
ncbi:MAG: hypothetical protein KUG71_06120 [Porticoccaceae bacterium]|nr:hypothetical protein [Porticoccaceae bacterium]